MTVPPENPTLGASAVHPTSRATLAPSAIVGKTPAPMAADSGIQPPTSPMLTSLVSPAACACPNCVTAAGIATPQHPRPPCACPNCANAAGIATPQLTRPPCACPNCATAAGIATPQPPRPPCACSNCANAAGASMPHPSRPACDCPNCANAAGAAMAPGQRKEDEVRTNVVAPSADAPRCQLEDFTPFSKSHLWKLMMSFYDRQGVESWAQGIVPHFITSNTFIAKKYSNVLRAYMRDAVRPNAASPLDPSEPFYIIELGTGSGKFSFYFLKALAEAEASMDFPLDNVRYIMTDFTEQNFNFWKAHPALAPFVARGIVDFAIFDATKDTELRLFNAQTVLRPGSCKNPVGIIANYLFDTLYHDLFQVSDGFLKEGLVSVGSKQAEEPDPLDPEIIKRLANLYKYEPIDADYYGDDKPHLNNILKWYHDFYDPQSPGATILVPVGALSAIDRLSQLAINNRLVILSGDKGNNNPDHFRGVSDPHIAVHGSFSVMVNYHAIGVYFASRGGFAIHSPQEEASLKVSLFVLPSSTPTAATPMRDLYGEGLERVCEKRSRSFPQLTQAFDDEITAFGPNDFFVMQKVLKEDTKTPSLKAALALLKLSYWDPDTFFKFRDVLLDHTPTSSPKLKSDVRMGIPQIWKNYYAMDREKDIAFEIGRVFYGLHDFDSALAFYAVSSQEMGKHHVTSLNMGLCHYSKRQLLPAATYFEEAFELNPTYQKAASWLLRVRHELGAAMPSGDQAEPVQLITMPEHEEISATRPNLSGLSLDENTTQTSTN